MTESQKIDWPEMKVDPDVSMLMAWKDYIDACIVRDLSFASPKLDERVKKAKERIEELSQ